MTIVPTQLLLSDMPTLMNERFACRSKAQKIKHQHSEQTSSCFCSLTCSSGIGSMGSIGWSMDFAPADCTGSSTGSGAADSTTPSPTSLPVSLKPEGQRDSSTSAARESCEVTGSVRPLMPPAFERARFGTYALGTGLLAKRARWVWAAAFANVGRLRALPEEAISTRCSGLPALLVLRHNHQCEHTQSSYPSRCCAWADQPRNGTDKWNLNV